MRFSSLARRPVTSTPSDQAQPDVLPAATIAHRGASAYAPENTLAAVRKGIARDADRIEFDVQRTRDGELVLMHDDTLERTTDVRRLFPGRGPWRVADFSRAELARLDAGSWKSAEFAGERIPTLQDALDVLALADIGALVELKAPASHPALASEVAQTASHALRHRGAGAPGAPRIVVQSFDHRLVREVKRLVPDLVVGVLGSPAPSRLARIATWADQVNPHHRCLDREYVERVHELGLTCSVWTVNRPSSMRRALRLGVDGVISDRPDVLHRVARQLQAPAP